VIKRVVIYTAALLYLVVDHFAAVTFLALALFLTPTKGG